MNKAKLQYMLRRMGFDAKKAIVMGGLLVVGLLLWGRLLLKEVPQTASAGGAMTALAEPQNDGLSEVLDSDREQVEVALPVTVKRDLFSFDANPYRRPLVPQEEATGPNPGPEGADEASRLAAVKDAAGRLRLESVMMGGSPHALINGVAVAPGEQIEGFTLLRVSDRNVLLKKNGFVIRLKM